MDPPLQCLTCHHFALLQTLAALARRAPATPAGKCGATCAACGASWAPGGEVRTAGWRRYVLLRSRAVHTGPSMRTLMRKPSDPVQQSTLGAAAAAALQASPSARRPKLALCGLARLLRYSAASKATRHAARVSKAAGCLRLSDHHGWQRRTGC